MFALGSVLRSLLWLLFAGCRAALLPRGALVTENVLLRHQLCVLRRGRGRPHLRPTDRALWALAARIVPDWRRHLILVRPETVVRWHRAGWRVWWRWRSRPGGLWSAARGPGRPRLDADVRRLIVRMARENPLWGSERIRGALSRLGIEVSARTVRRYRWRGLPAGRGARRGAWRAFLRRQARGLWAADLFTVRTLGFRTLYVLFFVDHARRRLVHFGVTSHPTAEWVWRRFLEATAWNMAPRLLLRDRDSVYRCDFGRKLARLGIRQLLSPIRAPKANAIAERLVGTLRRECLDHVLVLNEPHLRMVLTEFAAYYNQDRPHRTLDLQPPEEGESGAPPPAAFSRASPDRRVIGRPVLGGLHHAYSWADEDAA